MAVSALLCALLCMALVGFLLRRSVIPAVDRRIRRRRRRNDRPAAQVIGAWDEAIDLLRRHRFSVAPSSTVGEIASEAFTSLGDRVGALAPLAHLTTAALFHPVEPNEDDAREAQSLETRLRADLRKAIRHSQRDTVREGRRR
jgi:hypothetical protein